MSKLITADDIRNLRTAADDFESTERLKAECVQLCNSRGDNFYLTYAELDRIVKWKLRT